MKRFTFAGFQMRLDVLLYFSLLVVLCLPRILFGDDLPAPETTAEWLFKLATWVVSLKGASALAVVVGVTQVVMGFFLTPLGDFSGGWKLVIVTFLSLVGTVVGGMVTGLPFLQALLAGPALAAAQVFFHQVISKMLPSAPVVGGAVGK